MKQFCTRYGFYPFTHYIEELGMSSSQPKPRGLYFEEYQPAQKIITAGRTVTEADVVNFAGLSGDYNQMHVDEAYSQKTTFGKRVAHGLLVVSIVSGLAVQTGVMEGTVMAFREINEWKFARPVFFGDTVHAVLEVREKKELRRIGGGSVTIDLDVINQNDEVVMKGIWVVLIATRPNG
jgi:3-hydroxybutyryl-CoA dehydratase